MARNIDDSNMDSGVIGQVGKSQLNGNSPFLLLLQPVRIRPCKGLYETCLAVIHMTGGADDDVLHASTSAAVSAIYSMSSGKMVRTSSSSRPSVMRPMTGFSRQRRACSA